MNKKNEKNLMALVFAVFLFVVLVILLLKPNYEEIGILRTRIENDEKALMAKVQSAQRYNSLPAEIAASKEEGKNKLDKNYYVSTLQDIYLDYLQENVGLGEMKIKDVVFNTYVLYETDPEIYECKLLYDEEELKKIEEQLSAQPELEETTEATQSTEQQAVDANANPETPMALSMNMTMKVTGTYKNITDFCKKLEETPYYHYSNVVKIVTGKEEEEPTQDTATTAPRTLEEMFLVGPEDEKDVTVEMDVNFVTLASFNAMISEAPLPMVETPFVLPNEIQNGSYKKAMPLLGL